MANPSTAHEPSMEEILASIRQIISEDGEGSTASKTVETDRSEPSAPAASEEAAPESYESLVSRFESEGAPAAHTEPETASPPASQQSPARSPRPAAEQEKAAFLPRPAVAKRPEPSDDETPLLSPEKGAAISGAFGALAQTILAQNSRTLEDVVAEMLQPMLKSWLDDNLPSIVERMVKEEIERVSRGRR